MFLHPARGVGSAIDRCIIIIAWKQLVQHSTSSTGISPDPACILHTGMKSSRCISLSAGIQTADYTIFSGWVWSKVWSGVHKENRSKSGQEVEGWSEVSTPFLYIVPLAQTTSDASKAVPSRPVSQHGPSVIVGPTVLAQQKSNFFTITFERNAFSEIHDSNPRKHCYEKTLTFSQNAAVKQILK